MISIQDYRKSEEYNLSSISSYHYSRIHKLDIFQIDGFPIRIDHINNLSLIVDSMQNNRFDRFMNELKGLDKGEFKLIVDAIINFVIAQKHYFNLTKCRLPLSVFISAYALVWKIQKILDKRSNYRIFEIGAGCGYQSYFFAKNPKLKLYSQTEAAESFYLLQAIVNQSAYSINYEDFVFRKDPNSNFYYHKKIKNFENAEYVSINAPIKCNHYPWWDFGAALNEEKYDMVTSNANLLEMTPEALDNYLEFSTEILKDDGIFYSQCTGSNLKRNHEYLKEKLRANDFSVLFFCPAGNKLELKDPNEKVLSTHHAALDNLVCVKNSHPNKKFSNHVLNNYGNYIEDNFILDTFFSRTEKIKYSKKQFLDEINSKINELSK